VYILNYAPNNFGGTKLKRNYFWGCDQKQLNSTGLKDRYRVRGINIVRPYSRRREQQREGGLKPHYKEDKDVPDLLGLNF
jgi:hypothetical protein